MYFPSRDLTSLKKLIVIWLMSFFCGLLKANFSSLESSCWLSNDSSYSYQRILYDDTNRTCFCWRFFLLQSCEIIFWLHFSVLPTLVASIKGKKKQRSFFWRLEDFFCKKWNKENFFFFFWWKEDGNYLFEWT